MSRSRQLGLSLAAAAVVAAAALPRARAAVTQPDGEVMPKAAPSNELSLQELFDAREGEGVIDAEADAQTAPATFLPLCGFRTQLLLRESGARNAFGWYNRPEAGAPAPTLLCDETADPPVDPDGAPCDGDEVYLLIAADEALPPYGRASDPLANPGPLVDGASLASSPFYAGGEVGFVLLASERHYSQRELNPICVPVDDGGEPSCEAGEHWIPTIIYESVATPNAYYMGVEDQKVGPAVWGGNDGDFQDFVFFMEGLVCSGAGERCDTGLQGSCADGVTGCADDSGESECRALRSPSDERCNAQDDDCDGEADEGDGLCPVGELCVRGECVPPCNAGEFRCGIGEECDDEGICREIACVGVSCAAGSVCHGGECVAPCDGVACPYGQECREGACVDLCEGLDCGPDLVCDAGSCVIGCGCAGCGDASQVCDEARDTCVDADCAGVECGAGEHCDDGACVDDCEGAVCPAGERCELGQCVLDTSSPGEGGAPSSGQGGDDVVIPTAGSGGTGASTGGAAGGAGPAAGAGANDGSVVEAAGCGCRTTGEPAPSSGALALAALALAFTARRRR